MKRGPVFSTPGSLREAVEPSPIRAERVPTAPPSDFACGQCGDPGAYRYGYRKDGEDHSTVRCSNDPLPRDHVVFANL